MRNKQSAINGGSRFQQTHMDSADTCVEIPMIGTGASLNVAVAGSLVLYRLAGLCRPGVGS